MRVSTSFSRGRRCCHSNERAACWKREMSEYLGVSEGEFEKTWKSRVSATCSDEVPESFTMYETYGQDAEVANAVPTVMR